jgi:hypothetical protein
MRVLATLLALVFASKASAEPDPRNEGSPRRSKITAALVVAGVHVAYATWSYFAWYRGREPDAFHLERDASFGVATYAGGADKLGHAWSNYALTRGTTAVLVAGGWPRRESSFVAAGLTEIAFTLTEIQDGYVYGFDPHDIAANVIGAGLGLVMENVPAVDRLLDYRIEYFPSADYRYHLRSAGSVDVGQDYSGQSYLLSLHLGELPGANATDSLYWTRFVDLSLGFEAHHYSPEPEVRTDAPKQTLYVGISINIQGVLTHLLPDSTGRRIGHGTFEVFALPYTTLRFAETSRSP